MVAVEVEPIGQRERRLRSPASAMAAARFSSTTGEPVQPAELPVERRDLRPVLSARRRGARRSPPADTYGPRPPSASARSSAARALAISSWSQRERSWSRSSTSVAVGEPRVATGVVAAASARAAPCTSGSSGISRRARARARSPRRSEVVRGRRVALVEDQVDDAEHGGEAVGQLVRRRHPVRDPGRADLVLRAHQPLGHRRRGRRGTPARSRRW